MQSVQKVLCTLVVGIGKLFAILPCRKDFPIFPLGKAFRENLGSPSRLVLFWKVLVIRNLIARFPCLETMIQSFQVEGSDRMKGEEGMNKSSPAS